MTREQIKIALPLILAFAEGKTIQIKNGSRWIDIDGDKDELSLDSVVAYQDCFRIKPNELVHPVVSTMLPKRNRGLNDFIREWVRVKNLDYSGNTGLQFSINSTDDAQREYLFSGNALPLKDIAELADTLETPRGRKYTLNFALADDSIIDGKVLASMFDPRRFMCKITPLHRTNSCEANHIQTSGGYDSFVPYKKVEEDLKANGFDVIVFVPSYDEDNGLITCGNAILSGKKPTSSYKEVIF